MDTKPKHRSRRSFPNLQHLSLAPLSSRFPMDGDDDIATADAEDTSTPRPRSGRSLNHSYYQGKSAPTTPSILSRSNSRHRKSRRRSGHADMLDLDTANINLTKAKSAVGLDSAGSPVFGRGDKQHVRTATGTTLPLPRHASRRSQTDDEWLHRAGLVLAQESREYKGQTWLASRESSTSLVNTMSGGRFEEDDEEETAETSKSSRHHSRTQSRNMSRVASARPSRRGSMAALGSAKFDKFFGGMTPLDAPRGSSMEGGYFTHAHEGELATEPDFVEPEDGVALSGASDDEEIRSLSQQKGFGLGGLIDRLVGFSLFNVDEDAEDTETDGEGGAEMSKEENARVRQEMLRKRREALARAARGSAENVQRARVPVNGEEEGGWKDAAWLLGVASKVLY